jgi:hypothetical protein
MTLLDKLAQAFAEHGGAENLEQATALGEAIEDILDAEQIAQNIAEYGPGEAA